MERNIRDVLEEEVIYDHSQFGLLNNQTDDGDSSNFSPQSQNQPPHKRLSNKWSKLSRTAALCGAYISLGLCFSVTGPTLLYLKDQVEATIPEISYIFTLRSVGTLGGAFLGGFCLDKCNPYSAFFVIIAMMAISVGAMPWCKHLWMLMVSSVVIGVGNGMLDTGASTLCLQLWGKDSGPYMQALHFSYAVGGSLAPLLVEAFIVEVSAPNNTSSSRHVRSATLPLNSSEMEDLMTTSASIIEAVSKLPIEERGELQTTTDASLSSNYTTTSTTTIASILANQTTPIAEIKPKKPKPSVINGQAFGDSKQFDSIPLKNDPPPLPPTTTSIATNDTLSTTTIRSTTESTAGNANKTATENNEELVKSDTTKSNSPSVTEIFQSNGSTPLVNISSDVLSKTPIKNDTINTIVTVTAPTQEVHTEYLGSTTKLVVPDDKILNSTAAGSSEAASPVPTTTLTTPKSSTTSKVLSTLEITRQPVTSLVHLTSVSTTTSSVASITSSTSPPTTLGPVDSGDVMLPKSRGKSRGQQIDATLTTPTIVTIRSNASSEPNIDDIATTTNTAVSNDSEHPDQVPVRVSDYLERFGVTRMHMLYTVIAIIVLHSAFTFLFFLCYGSRNPANITAERHTADRKIKPFRPAIKLTFIGLMFSFYLMYVGSEVIFAQFLTTFALESPLKLPTSTANYITTTFWVAFAAGRFVAIFVAHFTNPTVMLIFNMGATVLGSMALCISGETNVSILYVGSALVGLGMASTFATGFVWTETHLLVTNRISASFSIASSMGEMIFPTITGSFMESHPMSLMYLVLSLTILCVVSFSGAWVLAKRKENFRFTSRESGYHLARQVDDEGTLH